MRAPISALNLAPLLAFTERVKNDPDENVRNLLWGILCIQDYNDSTALHPLMGNRDLFFRTYQDFQELVQEYGGNTAQVRDAVRRALGKEPLCPHSSAG